jgi:predicted transcriptional regulator
MVMGRPKLSQEEELKHVNFLITASIEEKVRRIAHVKKTKKSNIYREALDQYLNQLSAS